MSKTSTSPEAAVLHSLDELAAVLPPPDPHLLAAFLADISPADLVARGASIASSRVVTDSARIYAQAWDVWSKLGARHRALLVGFSPELLALGVEQARKLRDASSSTDSTNKQSSSERATRAAAAAQSFKHGLLLRDQARTALHIASGGEPTLQARIAKTSATAESADALAAGIERLVAIARELLAHKKDPIASRVKLARLSPDYVDALEAAGKEVRATAHLASAPAVERKQPQADLDRLDGINLHILSNVVHAFEAAHDLDPAIPRLVPIATRRLLGKQTRPSGHALPETPASPPAASPAPQG